MRTGAIAAGLSPAATGARGARAGSAGVQADAFGLRGMGHSDEQGVHAAEIVRDDFVLHACTVNFIQLQIR